MLTGEVDERCASGGDDDAPDPGPGEGVGREGGLGIQRAGGRGQVDGTLEVRRSGRRPLPTAQPFAERDRARVARPVVAGGVGAQQPQLAEIGGLLRVGRRAQRHDLHAEVPRPLGPLEHDVGPPRPHRVRAAGN